MLAVLLSVLSDSRFALLSREATACGLSPGNVVVLICAVNVRHTFDFENVVRVQFSHSVMSNSL